MSANVQFRVLRSVAFGIGLFLSVGAATLTVAASGKGVADLSTTDYLDFFCGRPLPFSLPAEPVIRPSHDGPVTMDVGISSFAFTPPDVTINVGDTVRWTNNGGSHTTTSTTAVWDSGFLMPGNMFSWTFNGPGMFPYICSIHPFMMGSITVSGPSPTLVVNEIDYDQAGIDNAEFIELKNVSGGMINLDPVVVELINGATTPTSYATIDLPNVDLAADAYYVICGDSATVLNCDLQITPGTNLIQNGAPDAVGLFISGNLVDAVSYEGDTGAPYTEGSGVGLADVDAGVFQSISRFPDGADTNVNNIDLTVRCITPGMPNSSDNTGCTATSPTPTATATSTPTPPQVILFSEDFSDNSAGWTLGTEWQIGPALTSSGQGFGFPDPGTDTTATADNGVAGIIIGGNAGTTIHPYYYIESPPVNASVGGAPVTLQFNRWLNSDIDPFMQNIIEVWNGSIWVQIWITGGAPAVTDNAWTLQTLDLTAHQNAALRVRFGMRVGQSGAFSVSSWNIDDVAITSTTGSSTPTLTATNTPTNTPTPFSGIHNVGTGQTFTSLTMPGGIFEAINNAGMSGSVTINITSDLSGEDGVVALNEFAVGNTILIKPSGAPRTITGSSATGIIRLNGADYVTIDGSTDGSFVGGVVGGNPAIRELTIENTDTSTSSSVIILDSGPNGAQHNVIKNLNIRGSGSDQTGYLIAIGGATGGTQGADNDFYLIENCSLRRAIIGIWSSGVSGNQNQFNQIAENDITGTGLDRVRRAAVTVGNENFIVIKENSIGGIDSGATEDALGIGVGVLSFTNSVAAGPNVANAEVYRNKINGIQNSSQRSAGGIVMLGTGLIFDNMVSGVISDATNSRIVAGIYAAGTSQASIAHNSVSMTGDRGSAASQAPSFALAYGTGASMSILNNILYTTQTSGGGVNALSYAIGAQSGSFTSITLNYNDFWSSGANDGGFRAAGTDYATLSAWRAATLRDLDSIEADPLFIDVVNDLHIQPTSPARNAGTDAGFGFDFDYETRPQEGLFDIGADETVGPTPTNTPTPADTPSVSGVITYGNAIGNPVPPRFVKNVSVASTVGSPPVGPVITGTPGTYTLTGFGAGSYLIKPTKPGGSNGAITSNDAARVAQGVVSSPGFVSQNQRFAADVSGNGAVSSNDAALIARFAAGLTGSGNAGQWKFFVTGAPSPLPTPPQTYDDSRNYASVTGVMTGQDYIGLLIGEVSGNWNPATHPRPVGSSAKRLAVGSGPERGIDVKLPQFVTVADKGVIIPVNVQGAADKEVISYEFDLRYDPAVIQPLDNPVDVAGSVSRGLMVVANPYEPGLLRVVVYGPFPIDENGLLLNLRFTAVGAAGSASQLTFERIMFNEGELRVAVTDGQLEISARSE